MKPQPLRFTPAAGGSFSSSRTHPAVDLALLILRLTVGFTFMAHGAQKLFGWFGGGGFITFAISVEKMGFPAPKIIAALAGASEFFGGLMLALGVAAELGALAIIFTMIVAIWKVTFKQGYFIQHNGYEYNLLIIAVCVAVILTGPGRWAVWRWGRR